MVMASSSAVRLQVQQSATPLSKWWVSQNLMLVTLPRVGIFPTQKGPPHAAAHHVVVRRILQADLT
ncbi:hypothetical protein WL1483_3118 [Aeromonas schubertii]|uniref:Uncharacterized protein n=1 Tax=Aeromonas schubertii TaxID=652 RepID=A0A0S2SLE3_9GAMM|nr:hypothetical protein WL1483_3118 [Aeromonas schubertii]